MRFTLRNKSKLIKAFGEDYYKLLISSLTAFAKSNREVLRRFHRKTKKMIFLFKNIQLTEK